MIKRAIPFALIAAVLAAILFFPHGKPAEAAERRVVTVWNVDTFEGGKGSRTAFLGRAARLAEQEREGVYYFVTSYSAEGALAALGKGERPDLLSFGVGLGEIAPYCKPLSRRFAGGQTAEGCRAVPWCGGGYVLFSLENSFGEEGKTAISVGGSNLPAVAAALAGIAGEELPAQDAYVAFLAKKYRYLLGTQRDRCRFASRGVTVYEQPLAEFCDLYQYISVFSDDRFGDCAAFLDALFSERVQGELQAIGMRGAGETGAKRTVNVFTPPPALAEIARAARQADAKFPEKYLKTI